MRALWSYYTLLLLALCCGGVVSGQENCEKTSDLWRDYKRFIPTEGSPLFTIKVNFVVPQKDDGTGNFSEKDEDHVYLFEHTFETVNRLWSKMKRPKDPDCYPHDDFIPDTYIRFVLNEIIYVRNTYYWDASNGSGCPNDGNWWLNGLEKEIRENPSYDGAINVYMPNLPDVYEALVIEKTLVDQPQGKSPCSELPSHTDLDRSSRINMAGGYNKYWWMKHVVPYSEEYNPEGYPWIPSVRSWMTGSAEHTMAHELGHSMGLNHVNEYHGRNKCDESIMNQRHGAPHNYLQPSEIGKIHRNLRMTNIRNFLLEDVYSEIPFVVGSDMEMSMSFRAYEDIIVERDASLKVTCDLDLPPEGELVIKPGGKLVLSPGGRLSTRGQALKSIILEKERSCFMKKKAKVQGVFINDTDQQIDVQVKKVRVKKKR